MHTNTKAIFISHALVTGQVVKATYRDQDGILSLRRFTVTRIWKCKKHGLIAVGAFDLNRRAPRTFLLDGLLMIDVAPGR